MIRTFSWMAAILLLPLPASAANVFGKCTFDHNGRTLWAGDCEMSVAQFGNRFLPAQIMKKGDRSSKFPWVVVEYDDKGNLETGNWSGPMGGSHAHDQIKNLSQNPDCIMGDGLKVCYHVEMTIGEDGIPPMYIGKWNEGHDCRVPSLHIKKNSFEYEDESRVVIKSGIFKNGRYEYTGVMSGGDGPSGNVSGYMYLRATTLVMSPLFKGITNKLMYQDSKIANYTLCNE